MWWCGGHSFTTSFCSYFLPFRVLILHILVLVVFAMSANNNWLPEDNGRKVTSLEAQTPFCHIFFRKNLITEEILYISEQSTTTANMMSKLIVRVLSFKMVLVIVVCISSLPRNEKKILWRKLRRKLFLFSLGFFHRQIECFSCNQLPVLLGVLMIDDALLEWWLTVLQPAIIANNKYVFEVNPSKILQNLMKGAIPIVVS